MGRIIGFVISCLVVGLILHWLGATPSTLGVWIADSAEKGWIVLKDFFAWGGGYILMGAMVLVPIAVIRWLIRRRKA